MMSHRQTIATLNSLDMLLLEPVTSMLNDVERLGRRYAMTLRH
jgi:hypothetical protein